MPELRPQDIALILALAAWVVLKFWEVRAQRKLEKERDRIAKIWANEAEDSVAKLRQELDV